MKNHFILILLFSLFIKPITASVKKIEPIDLTKSNKILAASVSNIVGVSCSGACDGSAMVTFSGGVGGPYTIQWIGGGSTFTNVVSSPFTCAGVCGGTYTVRVFDVNSTQIGAVSNVVISEPSPISISLYPSDASCSGVCDGDITSSVLGGTGAMTYMWTPTLETTDYVLNACVGNYTLTVTDQNSCVEVSTVAIMAMDSLNILMNLTNVSCNGGSDGSITTNVNGGAPSYTYSWQPGGMATSGITGLSAGTYTVTVTDHFGCIVNSVMAISEPTALSATITSTNPTSCGACDGSATAAINGGTSPYQFHWNTGTINVNHTDLCAGIYMLDVVDANGCTLGDSVSISNGGTLAMTTPTVTPDTCGQSVGAAIVNVTGAQGAVTYLWQPINYTTQSIANVPAGNYFVTVSDTTCSYSALVTITNYGAPNVVVTSNAASCGIANGLLMANGSGGTGPYQFSINGSAFSSNTTYNNLTAGVYTIVCKDANGCQSTITHNVQSTGMFVYFSTGNATCNLSNGTSFVNVTGGNSPYTFLWNDGSTLQTRSNLAAGNYTCTVTDNVGCVAIGNTTVNTQATIYLNYDYDYYNCGVNSLTATANFGIAPYTYNWTPTGQTTPTISNLTSGNYICQVVDANGCMATGQYWINNNSYSVVQGSIFADLNSDCNYDNGEESIIPLYITAINAANQQVGWAYVNNQNNTFQMYLPQTAGTYTINLSNYYYNYTTISFNCSNNVITLTGNCDTIQNLALGYAPIIGQDLRVYDYCGVARPGFGRSNSISYYNPGTVTVPAVVKMQLDNLLTYGGATPPPTSITGNLLEWNLGNLTHGQSGSITVYSTVPTIQNGGALGTVLHDSVWIEPMIGDNYLSDNSSACSSVIVGSYDPNMKEVFAENMTAWGSIDTTDTDLYYTVHFQNTGTDTAFTIVVNDTISDLLEMNTLEVLSASHPYTVSIQPNKVLQVRFDNILLVDSNKNEVLSHGYFHYKIRTKSNLTFGQQIENTADIYFDFNLPIITNTVVTPIQAPVGIKNNKTQLNAVVYPNPANGGSFKIQLNDASYKQLHFTLYNVAGMKVMDKQLASQPTNEISTTGLSTGIYFYQLMNADGKKISGKIVISN